MKTTLSIIAAILFCGTAYSQSHSAGKEPARSLTLSYEDELAALQNDYEEGKYIQPLDGEWTRAERDNGNSIVYTHRYKIPFAWANRQQFLHVGAVGGPYEVYTNGILAGYNESGITPAEFDITRTSAEGANSVEIVVLKNDSAAALSGGTSDPKIKGDVYIVSQPRVRVRDFTMEVGIEGNITTIQLGAILKSHLLNPKTVRVHYRLISPRGEEVSRGYRDADISMRGEDTVRFLVTLTDALHWSHEEPYLYTLYFTTQQEGRYNDHISYQTGIRTVGVSDGRLLINSRPVPLNMDGYGYNGNQAEALRELTSLKSSGITLIKIKSHPQNDIVYAICDRIGLYVCDQADIDTGEFGQSRARGGNPTNDPSRESSFVQRVKDMYYNSRNHPSVVMFSLAENSSNGYNLYKSYQALKSIEKERPVVYLDGGYEWNSDAYREKPAVTDSGRIILADNNFPIPVEKVSVTHVADNKFLLTNNYFTKPVRNARIRYTVRQGNKKVKEGVISADISPGGSSEIEIPRSKMSGSPAVYHFDITEEVDKEYCYIPRQESPPAKKVFGKKNATTTTTDNPLFNGSIEVR